MQPPHANKQHVSCAAQTHPAPPGTRRCLFQGTSSHSCSAIAHKARWPTAVGAQVGINYTDSRIQAVRVAEVGFAKPAWEPAAGHLMVATIRRRPSSICRLKVATFSWPYAAVPAAPQQDHWPAS